MARVVLGELMERLTHARRRMSTQKGDRDTIMQAMQVIEQMAIQIHELDNELVPLRYQVNELTAQRDKLQEARVVLADA